ncbi:MAG: sec-independent translocation protein MttA [Flavobacteriaceae bacterium]|nr:sec-independent translocation protein MttA [Flavobacteriaceae bacterium]|tara:strand:- start:7462 stop:7731 length:270 start_codon:yes stop_codon:yes gene_type:complete
MVLFISGAEIVVIFFFILLVFGADKIPSIARGLAKGMTQIRNATNEIKSEIEKSSKIDDASSISKGINEEVDKVKKDFDNLKDSIKREI